VTFTSWSPSRLADYEQCPLLAKLKHLDKLCTVCFKGRLSGGFDGEPVSCDTCHKTITKSPALERGTLIGAAMEGYLKGDVPMMPAEVASPLSRKIASDVRKAYKAAKAKVEMMVVLDKDWRPVAQFAKTAWLRAKMDAVLFKPRGKVHVIDWKTGGVDKSTQAPRSDAKYDDQLSIYAVATLSAFATVTEATAALVFLDAARDPVVERARSGLRRDMLGLRQAEWTTRVVPMFSDDTFAPCPTFKCRFCDYRKDKGGPCQF
jgi:hypothetical protein